MKRKLITELIVWLNDSERKPLILRGARQTGKTYIIRQLAESCGKQLVEINFEKNPDLGELFESNDTEYILSQIELSLNIKIRTDECILFLDEIQECPFILSKLRWFYEDRPNIPVVAAGSLLEFALDEFEDSMPVGRVTYKYLHPLSYIEFLWAVGEEKLADNLQSVRKDLSLSDLLHKKYIEYYRQYCLTGGMPASVESWRKEHDINKCISIQKDLLTSFRDDFNKYRKRISPEIMRKTMNSVAYQLGGKFVYTEVDRSVRQPSIKTAEEMLEKAGICKRVYYSSGNGIPLGAEKNDRLFKTLFLDTGLVLSILGVRPLSNEQLNKMVWSDNGALAEQMCGQLLLSTHSSDNDDMFYWQQNGSGTGEIDYLVQEGMNVLPIEVKAGVSGSMKSLHYFMETKKLEKAIRFDLNKPSLQEVNVKTTGGKDVRYTLLSLPLYMTELALSDEGSKR